MVQPMYMVSKPTSRGLSATGIGCLFIRLRTYFQRTVRVECSLFMKFLNLPPGNCLPGCSIFIWFPNQWLAGSAAFFYLFRTYIQGTVCWGASCFLQFPYLPPNRCIAMSQSFFFSVWPVCFPRLTDNQTKAVGISIYLSLSLSLFLSLSLSLLLSLSFSLSLFLSLSVFLFFSHSLSLSLWQSTSPLVRLRPGAYTFQDKNLTEPI